MKTPMLSPSWTDLHDGVFLSLLILLSHKKLSAFLCFVSASCPKEKDVEVQQPIPGNSEQKRLRVVGLRTWIRECCFGNRSFGNRSFIRADIPNRALRDRVWFSQHECHTDNYTQRTMGYCRVGEKDEDCPTRSQNIRVVDFCSRHCNPHNCHPGMGTVGRQHG